MRAVRLTEAEHAALLACVRGSAEDPELLALESVQAKLEAAAHEPEPTAEDPERWERIGHTLAEVLYIPRIRSGPGAGWYRTDYGTKTAAGLGGLVSRIVETGGPVVSAGACPSCPHGRGFHCPQCWPLHSTHDPRDYAADPDSLPPGSLIGQALALGARFTLEGGTWVCHHPLYLTMGRTQVEAARHMTRYASPPEPSPILEFLEPFAILARYGTVLRIYDAGEEFADRYTVLPPRWASVETYGYSRSNASPKWQAIGAGPHPYHPQGFGQHTGADAGTHLGFRIRWADLPPDVQRFARETFPEFAPAAEVKP